MIFGTPNAPPSLFILLVLPLCAGSYDAIIDFSCENNNHVGVSSVSLPFFFFGKQAARGVSGPVCPDAQGASNNVYQKKRAANFTVDG